MKTHHPTTRAALWALGAVAAAATAGVVQFASTAIAAADDDTTDPGTAPSVPSQFDMTPIDIGPSTFIPSRLPAGDLTGGYGDRGDLVGVPNGPINVGPAPFVENPPDEVVYLDGEPGPRRAPSLGDLFDVADDG